MRLNGDHVWLDGSRFFVGVPDTSNALRAEYLHDRYEMPERTLIREVLRRDLPTIELGAGIGVISTLTNRQLQHPEWHIVLEANPSLLPMIKRNRAMNDAQFQARGEAYAAHDGDVTFRLGDVYTVGAVGSRASDASGRLTNQEVTVRGVSLATLQRESGFSPFNLVCDIEGGEFDMIDHEIDVLAQHVAVFIAEIHNLPGGPEHLPEYFARLHDHGFEKVESLYQVHAFINSRFTGG